MKYDYDKIHSSLWENHKVTWTASSLFIPIIFTLEGYFLQQYFEKFGEYPSLKQILIFVFGALLIQSLAIIWYFIMSSFHDLNENRIERLKKIEDNLYYKDSPKDLHLVNQYNCLFPDPKKDEPKKISKTISQYLQSWSVEDPPQTVSVKINVKPATTITWSSPVDISYGTPLYNAHLNAKAKYSSTGKPADGSFAYKKEDGTPIDEGTVLSVGTYKLNATFMPTNSNSSILSRIFALFKHLKADFIHLLASFLYVFTLIFYVPLIMPLTLMKKYNIFEDCLNRDKQWHIMKIYLLVVLLLYSLNLVIFVYLLKQMINGGAPQLGNDFLNLTVNSVNLTVNMIK